MSAAPPKPPRPNLFIVGAPKCGTTAWVEYLRTHPDIFFPEVKEPHYFASDIPKMRWTHDFGEYEELFAKAGDAKVVGEASVMYLCSTNAAQEIRAYNPRSKILVFLRAQEDFLPSLHHQFLYRFTESIEDFETAWQVSGKRPPDTIPKVCRHPKLLDYKAMGRFGDQLDRYFDLFPQDQIRIVRFDEWTRDPRAVYLQILDFLGLEDDGRKEFPPVNEAKAHRNKLIGKFLNQPPRAVQIAVRWIRKLTGRRTLGIAGRASRMMASRGYRTTVSPALREEIRDYYRDGHSVERLSVRGSPAG